MKKTKILSILLVSCICLAGCQEKETYVSVREKNKAIRLKEEKIQNEKDKELESVRKETQEERKAQAKLDENGNKIAKIAVDLVSIRELPDARAPKLITLERGNEVGVTKTAEINGEEWSEISVNDLKGYILTKYIEY